ncbi:MAG TPA: hypothetical protein PKD91_11405 [Bacteroidia bacterium]|nr:hypothetical protein [Bacteroidia bacterium]
MKKVVALFLVLIMTASCSLEIQKRHYRSGYHISISKKYHPQQKVPYTNIQAAKFKKPTSEALAYIPEAISSDRSKQHYPTRTNVNPSSGAKYTSFIKHAEKTSNGIKYYFHKSKPASRTNKNTSSADSKKIQTEKAKNKNSDNWFLSITALCAAFIAGIFKPAIPKTRKVGYWALNHRKTSRVLHFVSHSILAGCGLFLGKQLYEIGIVTSDFGSYILAGTTSFFALLYPIRKHKTSIFKNTYTKQKLFALALVMSGFSLFLNIGNRIASHDIKLNSNYTGQIFSASSSPMKPIQNFQEDTTQNGDKAAKIIFTVLTCLISLILTFLIVAASCSLSCSGQGALSAIVLIVGIPALIIGTVAVIKAIWKPKKIMVN